MFSSTARPPICETLAAPLKRVLMMRPRSFLTGVPSAQMSSLGHTIHPRRTPVKPASFCSSIVLVVIHMCVCVFLFVLTGQTIHPRRTPVKPASFCSSIFCFVIMCMCVGSVHHQMKSRHTLTSLYTPTHTTRMSSRTQEGGSLNRASLGTHFHYTSPTHAQWISSHSQLSSRVFVTQTQRMSSHATRRR